MFMGYTGESLLSFDVKIQTYLSLVYVCQSKVADARHVRSITQLCTVDSRLLNN